jgi:hypothetical protein
VKVKEIKEKLNEEMRKDLEHDFSMKKRDIERGTT